MSVRLPRAPGIVFLFGLAGAGKSWVGDVLATHTGWHVYHADEDLTDELRHALAEHRPFTDPMRDRYLARVAERIAELRVRHSHVIVTQGLYRERHRQALRARFADMTLVCVTAPQDLVMQRIRERPDGISEASARALIADFEPPDTQCLTLFNLSDAQAVLDQAQAWWG